MEIDVKEYVRINNDFRTIALGIGKVVRINQDTIYVKMNFETPIAFKIDNIVKHSKNIIDLIEIKDIIKFKNKLPNSLENEEMIIHIFDKDTLNEVKEAIQKQEIKLLSIVTKEQFKSVEYRLEE